ncbi:VanW family protein [Amycolatopsis sp. H20-H5]|nr:VanW family protein [Amycolatopsis sp. H20-H5]MEC3980647.1 VanW family protein [Amycolatopsis sp. H20-H5]
MLAENDPDLVEELFEGDRVVPPPATPATRFRKGLGKVFLLVGGFMVLFVVCYAVDLITSAGDVPRGVTVTGIGVGGLTHADAEAKLRRELGPRLTKTVQVRAGDVQATLEPAQSGLGVDWPNTLGQAGHQPLNPFTRILSFFTSREVGVVTKTDPKLITQAVSDLAARHLDHAPVEGSIAFKDLGGGNVTPYPVEPRQGQSVADVESAVTALTDGWLGGGDITMNVVVTPVKATSAGVHAALDKVVVPAVAKPVVVHGEGADAILKPDAIASSFQFVAKDGGAVEVRIDQSKLQASLAPGLKGTETDGQDAQIVFDTGQPTIVPSEDGRKVNWENTFKPLTGVLAKADGRELNAVYDGSKPAVTTEAAGALGIKEVIGEFSTGGFSGPAAVNIQALAARVSGTLVKPGETFSLGARSGPRTAATGYVPAPADEDGTGPVVVGGGVSQFASTLYNAAYLAGLADGGHLEHETYFDRYPVGRDAKAINADGSAVELKIADDTATGFAIQASAGGDSVTVRIWGTRHVRVEGTGGDQSNFVAPPVQFGSGDTCRQSGGTPGFSVSSTRVLYDLATANEVRRDTRNTTYAPKPTTLCP